MVELSVKEFLDSFSNRHTEKEYRHGIKKFCEWYGKTAEQILEMRKDDQTQKVGENLIDFKNRASRFEKEIENFHSYLLEQGSAINTARILTIGIRQLFRFYQMPVMLRSGSAVTKTVLTTRSFPLTIEHVRQMFAVGDLRQRVVLSMATDLGLRIGDFLRLKKTDLPDLSQPSPIAFDIMTDKEDVIAHGFLSAESVVLLKAYVPTLQRKNGNPYLFPSNAESHISDEWLNQLLQNLAEKAGLNLNGKDLTFHCFRKQFLSAAIDSGIGLTAGKMLVGKAVAQSDGTYLTTVKLRQKFVQLKTVLAINEEPKIEAEKIGTLTTAIASLQEDLTTQKQITEAISQQNIKLKPLADFVAAFQSPEELQRFLDLLKSSSVVSFPEHNIGIVNWEISPELHQRLKTVAKAEGKTEDELIQAATKQEVERLEKQRRKKAVEK